MEARRPGILISAAMDICYGLLALTAWPVYVPLILTKRKWREGLAERLGVVPRLRKHPFRLWVHAISVGEVEAARSFVPALAKACPDAEIVISDLENISQRASVATEGVHHVTVPRAYERAEVHGAPDQCSGLPSRHQYPVGPVHRHPWSCKLWPQ